MEINNKLMVVTTIFPSKKFISKKKSYKEFFFSLYTTSEGQRNYKSKIKKKIRKKCPSMTPYFAPSSYPELMVYIHKPTCLLN